MFQLRIHGRAGQGAKTIAQLLAEAALKENKFVQAFPYYGPARTGAPMNAFVRLSDEPINIYSQVKNPDAVLVIDPLLVEIEDVGFGMKKGVLIINSSKKSKELKKVLIKRGLSKTVKVFSIPASKIALERIKKDIANIVLLGALVGLTKVVDLENLIKVMEE